MKRLSISTLKVPAVNKTLLFECEKLHSVETKNMASGLLATGVGWFEGEIG
jgi:hypothetical protein